VNDGFLRERASLLVSTFRDAAAQRHEAARRMLAERAGGDRDANERRESAAADARRRADRGIVEAEMACESALTQATAQYGAEIEQTRRRWATERERLIEKADHNRREAKRQLQESLWLAETVYEAGEKQPRERCQATLKGLDALISAARQRHEEASQFIRAGRQPVPVVEPVTAETDAGSEALIRLDELSRTVQELWLALRATRGLKFFRGAGLPLLIVVLPLIAAVVTAVSRGGAVDTLTWSVGGGSLVLLVLMAGVLYLVTRRSSSHRFRGIGRALSEAELVHARGTAQAQERREREEQEAITRRDTEITKAKAHYEPILNHIEERRTARLSELDDRYPGLIAALERDQSQRISEAQAHFASAKERIEAEREERLAAIEREYEAARARRAASFDEHWKELTSRWSLAARQTESIWTLINRQDSRLSRPWDDPAWNEWVPPSSFDPSIRFGALRFERSRVAGGVPDHADHAIALPEVLTLPATIDFGDRASLLIRTDGPSQRDQAVRVMQTVMMRLLTGLPPGKVRFVIVDPVGLGQNFAGFMHLADWDESFVGGRIWTEERHIEQRLVDLTEHMENVIQKYLRNDFETIAEYNEQAGEIAEPYRFLVICDFPVHFSENAARRLAAIAASGARCGVHVLLMVDDRQGIPPGVAIEDLEQNAVILTLRGEDLALRDEVLGDLTLTLDAPPPDDFVTRTLHIVGEAAKDATRVEVPFSVIAPAPDRMWSLDASSELRVPLGRCGATKLQYLTIGTGTSQHALIAGKTGSGKSTLLHVLVTNLALWYGPDEVQFYLVDFKKGVEFKTYASADLPHARAVAVESDREFGLSVLHRVDAELRRRGDRYRALGVQDLAGFRREAPGEPMPRTLLIIDEFQELFVEDDRIAQEASLLLDRIVRQGRAFGIHAILGSQTLGGAYTLARSTLGQMQVRIALQCTEADSYLILSDDNAAARLLGRPGEAIYNDAGGAIVGNSPFQIVWLPEPVRDERLAGARDLARSRGWAPPAPMIVFEGSAPAEFERNHLVVRAKAERDAAHAAGRELPQPEVLRGWIGEAIAIKDPTSAAFRRRSGSNLLIVGQRDEPVIAMTSSIIRSLGAQVAAKKEGMHLALLDGTPADSPMAGRLASVLAEVPQSTEVIAFRDLDARLAAAHGELQHRISAASSHPAPYFLFIHGLHRFRLLRTSDDFGFSSFKEEQPATPPDRMLAELLREGPIHGMHIVIWCDSVLNLTRWLDRQSQKEFGQKVLLQMSAADSTQLIDNPSASILGLARALLHDEEEGVSEKFRPYSW